MVIRVLTRGKEVDLLVGEQGEELRVRDSSASLPLIHVLILIIAGEVCRGESQGARPESRRDMCRQKLSEYYHLG